MMNSVSRVLILILLAGGSSFGQLPLQSEIDFQMDSIWTSLKDTLLAEAKGRPFWQDYKDNFVSPIIASWDTSVLHAYSNPISEYFAKEDLAFFLEQIGRAKNRKWDKARIGSTGLKLYRKGNTGNIWGFSLPLFTKDRQSFIIQFGYYCGNLCGSGCTYIYRKEGNKWTVWKMVHCWIS